MIEAAEPLSNGVQVGLRIPVILIGLAGVVLMLIFMKRLGVVAALLGALGSFLIAVDQIINIVWVVHTTSLATSEDFDAEHFNSVTNIYTFTDVALITIGTALVVLAIGFGGRPRPFQRSRGTPASRPARFSRVNSCNRVSSRRWVSLASSANSRTKISLASSGSSPTRNSRNRRRRELPTAAANYPQQQPYQAPPQPYQPYQPPSQPGLSARGTAGFGAADPAVLPAAAVPGAAQPAPPPNYQQPPYPGQQ